MSGVTVSFPDISVCLGNWSKVGSSLAGSVGSEMQRYVIIMLDNRQTHAHQISDSGG